jgi:nucleoside-diphosphate-sugar epimerase
MRKALIAGATGAIGSVLLNLLNDSDQYSEIHCIGRREPATTGEKIKVHIVSSEELEQFELDQTIDDVFCAIGTTIKSAGSVENFKRVDRDYVHQVGRLAQRLNAKTCSVVSAIGATSDSSNYYNQTKGEAEDLLSDLGLTSLRVFRPSMLHGGRDEFRFKEVAGYVVLTILAPLLQGSRKKYRAIRVEQVAKAMYESAARDYPSVRVFESDEIQSLTKTSQDFEEGIKEWLEGELLQGKAMLVCGFLLGLIGVLFYHTNILVLNGIALPLMVLSCLVFGYGTNLVLRRKRQVHARLELYQKDPHTVVSHELERAQKENRGYKLLKLFWLVTISLGTLLFWFTKQFRRGVGFGVAFCGVCGYVVDTILQGRVVEYSRRIDSSSEQQESDPETPE